ncbi:MAG: peptidoglycan DD-metalloendopeptidase family protein [Rhizobiaceae bacterium]|nr:peptidoglycan DD-metalloendopeptidase family protein [Rhizobiaceae bacterium]
MRTNILARRFSALSKASSLVVLLSFATACSNDVMRLDTLTTASITNTSNQSQIIGDRPTRLSNYGDEYDPRQPNIHVAKRSGGDSGDGGGYRPQSSYSKPGRYASLKVTPPSQSPTINRSALPPVESSQPMPQRTAKTQPIVLQPRQSRVAPLRVNNTDSIVTGAVTDEPKTTKSIGWDSSKGTRVTVRSGETLYNLSRRYGVPVSAIMSANQISDANSVEAGKQILIPTYNYSSKAPISAPDNHPITKASRASRGFQGQPRGRVAVPKVRTANVASQPKTATVQAQPKLAATGQTSHYVVKSGDTLSGIAYRTGASMAAIRASNNMSDNTVRLGQTLIIPAAGTVVQPELDTTRTGSIPASNTKTRTIKQVDSNSNQSVASITPAKQTATQPVVNKSAAFRWPAEGRVISKFGERLGSGTNDGIDISMPIGTPVKASQKGTVIYAGSELEDFGNLILVSHNNGWVSAYAHSSANLVRRGQKVARGQTIAKSGRSGNAGVPKLHFELRKDSNPVNPLKHLDR